MAKRTAVEALDDLLRDLMDSQAVFGGKVIVLGGDFRQTLPVVPNGNKSETISACLTNSPIWPLLCQFQLQQNMRALLDPMFTEFLLKVGDGTGSLEDDDLVTLPTTMLVQPEIDSLNVLIEYVYPNICKESLNITSNLNRAILTTKNIFVDEINDMLIQKFPGEEVEYISFDETLDPNDQAQYEDFLHSLTPNGMPPHRLVLKTNAPIILLRNMNPTEGLCNGTRLFCKEFKRNIIRAEIAFGDFSKKEVFIHRIPLQPPSGDQYIVPFKRVQFPIRLCFAMTINKSQGQTLDFVGVYLKEPVFSHGQLYVALSRARKIENAKVSGQSVISDDDVKLQRKMQMQEGNFECETRQLDLEKFFGRYGRVDRADMKSDFIENTWPHRTIYGLPKGHMGSHFSMLLHLMTPTPSSTFKSRKLSNILDINLELKKRWTVLVQVLETGHINPSRAGDNYRRLLFTDSQGTKVYGLIYTNYLRYFSKTFKPYKRYYISNANLSKTQPHFRISSYEFSWSLTSTTLVEEYPEDIPPILPCEFHFTPFKELHKHAESNRFQNVRGMVIKCYPSQQVDSGPEPTTKRDVVIVNEEYKENKAEILQLLEKNSFKDSDELLPYPAEEDIVSIATATASWKTSKTAWIKGKLALPTQDRTFSHTGCANCLKPLDADVTWIVTCPSCKMESEVLLISRAMVEINDETGSIRGTITTPDIEKFIPFTPAQLKDAEEFGKNVHNEIATSIHSMSVVAYVRSYETTIAQQLTTKISIVKAHRVKENSLAELLPQPQTRKRKEPTTSTSHETENSDITCAKPTKKTT